MATLFTPSTLPWVSAVQQIADCVGASADTEMQGRAHLSLRAAFGYLNSKKWDFVRSEANPLQVIGPFTVTGISASAGQASAAAPAGHGIKPDDLLAGSGFMLGTRVSATAASGFGIFGTITATAAGVQVITATASRDLYDLPSDLKAVYSVRSLGTQKAYQYIGRRTWDRTITDELSFGTPERYDLFVQGSKGKIRLLPGPNAADVLQIRYFRRLFMATASGAATALDIPEDYELTPIAWAKWHFLTDKAEGRSEQGNTWFSLSQEGLKTMVADQANMPDDNLAFIPGASAPAAVSDRSQNFRDQDW